jgi:hypothetical protein
VYGGHKQVGALLRVECQHADCIASAERALAERLDEILGHLQLRPRSAEVH